MTCIHLGKRVTLLYENILPTLVSEVGKTPIELDDQDIIIILCIVAKVADQLKNIKLNKQKPRDFALTLTKPIGYKKTIPALFVIYSFNDLELDRPYSSAEFQEKIKREIKTDVSNDTTDLLSGSYQQESKGYKISSKEMNKAIEALKRDWINSYNKQERCKRNC
jgi:hypothetical protein